MSMHDTMSTETNAPVRPQRLYIYALVIMVVVFGPALVAWGLTVLAGR